MDDGAAGRLRRYSVNEAAVFYRTNEIFGAFSNMARGFPIVVNEERFGSSEALYQAIKFPLNPDLQKIIANATSPVDSKRVCAPFLKYVRADWPELKVPVMKMVISLKYLQYQRFFIDLFEKTEGRPIVEMSSHDLFWGARQVSEELVGENVLGRLWMSVRDFSKCNGVVDQKSFFVSNNVRVVLFEREICRVDW